MRTANVELPADLDAAPGPYVCLSVTDDGAGMSEATLSRALEPFFTTKGPGQGTGLGLSTVFGIARQAGGCIGLESELGAGSTVSVYLPRPQRSSTTSSNDRLAARAIHSSAERRSGSRARAA